MAGWKLRKDKAAAETPGAPPDSEVPAEPPASAAVATAQQTQTQDNAQTRDEAAFLDLPPLDLPDFDTEPEGHFAALEFDRDADPALPDGSALTLVDYTASHEQFKPDDDLTAGPHAAIYDLPAMPPPADFADAAQSADAPAPTAEDPDSDFEPLHASSWLSPDFSAGIPAVAPFVLDTPLPAAAAPAAPRLTLRIGRLSAEFDLIKDITTIGRPDSTLHYYPDIEIEMDDAVSRRHAEIVRREDGYRLVDTGSTNGTSLNGEPLTPHQERRLAHGDRIRVGDRTEITFEE